MKKKIRWFSVFLAASMLFMSLNVNVFAEEDTMANQANDEPLGGQLILMPIHYQWI